MCVRDIISSFAAALLMKSAIYSRKSNSNENISHLEYM